MAQPVRQQDEMIPSVRKPSTSEVPAETRKEATVRDISGQIPLSVDDRAMFRSPARRMQETLGREFAAVEDEPWSPRRTVAFVTLTCGAFWTCVYFVVRAALG